MKIIYTIFIKLILILFVPLISGCSATPDSYINSPIHKEISNQFGRDSIHYYSDSITIKNTESDKPDFSFFRINFTKTSKEYIWHLSTFYLAKSVIMDQTLVFTVDGNGYSFSPEPFAERRLGSLQKGYVDETRQFIVADTFIPILQSAHSVIVKLSGQNYYQEKVLSPAELDQLISFINKINNDIIDLPPPHKYEDKP